MVQVIEQNKKTFTFSKYLQNILRLSIEKFDQLSLKQK